MRNRYGCGCCIGHTEREGEGQADVADDSQVFGEKADYWEIHDEIIEKFDGDMVERLHTGLDNLLVFVSEMVLNAHPLETNAPSSSLLSTPPS